MIRKSDYENYDYRQFWEDNKRAYEDKAERLVIKKFFTGISQKDKVFADFGCGFGRLFEEYAGFERIIMIDYSLNNLKNAKKLITGYLKKENNLKMLEKIFFVLADVNNLPLKNGILDACLTVRVIHHLPEPEKFFSEVSRVIKPQGLFFIEFANKRNLKNILRFIFGRMKGSPFNTKPYQVGETILDYHPGYIKSLLKNLNFKIIRQVSASNFRLNFFKKNINLRVLLFFENLYQNLFSFMDLGPSIFLKTIFNPGTANNLKQEEFYKALGQDKASGQDMPAENNEKVKFEKLFICPACKSDLRFKIIISCSKCERQYPVTEGILIFN